VKLNLVLAKKSGITAVVILVLLVAGTVVLAAGEALLLRQAVDVALKDNPAARLATVRAERARNGAEQLRQRVDGAVYRLITNSLQPGDLSLVYVAPTQAEQMERMAPLRERAARELLVLETQTNYLELYRAMDRLNLAGQALARAREQQRLAEVAFQAGTVARSDILVAQAHVAAAEAQIFAAESSVQTARAALNKSLGRPLADLVELPEQFSVPERRPLDLQRGLEGADADRLDVIIAREALLLSQIELSSARHTLASAALRDAELAVDEARLQLQTTVEAVRLEVFQLYHRLAGVEKQLAALEQGVRSATEAHRLAVLRYQAGVGTQMDVTAARDALAEREQELLHARYEGYLGHLSWRLAIGQPLE